MTTAPHRRKVVSTAQSVTIACVVCQATLKGQHLTSVRVLTPVSGPAERRIAAYRAGTFRLAGALATSAGGGRSNVDALGDHGGQGVGTPALQKVGVRGGSWGVRGTVGRQFELLAYPVAGCAVSP